MKKFKSKKGVVTVVEDNDPRIVSFKKNGWEEIKMGEQKPVSLEDEMLQQSIKDANDSESDGLIKTPAKAEGEPVDDKAANTEETPVKEPKEQEGPKEPAVEEPKTPAKPKADKIKAVASNKKVNETIKANLRAKAESEPVDDGLIKG